MTTIEYYFSTNMGSSEREIDSISTSIYEAFFIISNLQGVRFADASGKPINIPDPTRHPIKLIYFTFRYALSTTTVDNRAPVVSLSLEFLLRLLQIFSSYHPTVDTTTGDALSKR